jgi:hypothetical protein
MKKLLVILAISSLSFSAFAQSNTAAKSDKLVPGATLYDCLNILGGLNEIDGKHTVIFNAGKPNEGVIEQVYEFGNGALRQDIAYDIAILSEIQKSQSAAQQKILMEVSHGRGEIKAPDDKATQADRDEYLRQFVEYNKLLTELTSSSCDISNLKRIKISDLKLNKNEIRGAALAAIDKILDKDK